MELVNENKLTHHLALALIYLSAWKEKHDDVYRAWKGCGFSILDDLKEQGLINFSNNSKSLYLSHKGEEKAKQLVEKLDKICKGSVD